MMNLKFTYSGVNKSERPKGRPFALSEQLQVLKESIVEKENILLKNLKSKSVLPSRNARKGLQDITNIRDASNMIFPKPIKEEKLTRNSELPPSASVKSTSKESVMKPIASSANNSKREEVPISEIAKPNLSSNAKFSKEGSEKERLKLDDLSNNNRTMKEKALKALAKLEENQPRSKSGNDKTVDRVAKHKNESKIQEMQSATEKTIDGITKLSVASLEKEVKPSNVKDEIRAREEIKPDSQNQSESMKDLPSIISSPFAVGMEIKRQRNKNNVSTKCIPSRKPHSRSTVVTSKELASSIRNAKQESKRSKMRRVRPRSLQTNKIDEDLDIIIRPEDICGSGVIWVKRHQYHQ